MASITYFAYAGFRDADFKTLASFHVDSFSVDGGTTRVIELSKANDMSISSEFEQARANKNLVFYKPPSKDFTDVNLINLFQNKTSFNMYFHVLAKKGKTVVQSLMLQDDISTLKQNPMILNKKLLIWISITPNATITFSKDDGGNSYSEKW